MREINQSFELLGASLPDPGKLLRARQAIEQLPLTATLRMPAASSSLASLVADVESAA